MVTSEVLVLNAPRMAAGALMLGLAIWVLTTDFRSKLFRAFALFLTLRGVMNLILPFESGTMLSANLNFWAYMTPYFQIAVPFAALAFVVRLRDPEGTRRWSSPLLWGMLGLVTILELVYLLDHSTYFGSIEGASNWLFLTMGFGDLAYVAAGHALLRHGPKRRFTVAAAGLMLFPAFAGGLEIAQFAQVPERGTWQIYQVTESYFFVVTRIAALVYAITVLAFRLQQPVARMGLAVVTLAALSGLMWAPIYLAISKTAAHQVAMVMNGLWTIAMPAAVGHALLRGRLPDNMQTLSRGAWLMASGFLLVSAAMFLSLQGLREAGILVGVVAITVLAVLAMGSIERTAATY